MAVNPKKERKNALGFLAPSFVQAPFCAPSLGRTRGVSCPHVLCLEAASMVVPDLKRRILYLKEKKIESEKKILPIGFTRLLKS